MLNHSIFAPFFNAHRPIAGLALLGLLVFSDMANAASITFQSAGGNWSSYSYDATAAPQAPAYIQGVGTDAVYWGEPFYSPTGPQKSLVFQGSATPATPASTPFAIGWLTHANNAIYGGTNITGANLSLQLSLTGYSPVNFNYNFSIFQDPNTYADWLTFSPVGSTQFSLGGQAYAFNLMGFYNQVSSSTYSTLIVQDGSTASQIPIYASVTAVQAVPVPAAFWLLGSGLLGLAGFSRRKRTPQ